MATSMHVGAPIAGASPASPNTTSSNARSENPKPAKNAAKATDSAPAANHGSTNSPTAATTAVVGSRAKSDANSHPGTKIPQVLRPVGATAAAASPVPTSAADVTARHSSASVEPADSSPDLHHAAPATGNEPATITASAVSKSIAPQQTAATAATALTSVLGEPLTNDPITPVDSSSLVVLTDAVRRELSRSTDTTTAAAPQTSTEPVGNNTGVPSAAVAVNTAPAVTATTTAAAVAAATSVAATTKTTAAVPIAATTTTSPVANNDGFSITENTVATGNVLTNDTAPAGSTLTAKLVSGPKSGTVTLNANGTFTYTPNVNFTGTDTFTYVASTGKLTSAVATVGIAVTTPPKPIVGTMGVTWYAGLTQAQINEELAAAKAAGAISMRIDISWFAVGATKGTYNFSMIDPIVQDIVNAGLIPLGMIFDTPQWLSGSTNPHTPPANATQDQQFAQFAAATAQHYAGIITYFEVWNEENIPAFWPGPNAASYTKLLQYTYTAIKAAEPGDFVIAGGLSPDPSGINSTTFVQQMYADGAKGYFDALAYHWYAFPNLPTITPLAQIYNVMVANGDARKQIWITETGAPTGTAPGAVSAQVQANTVLTVLDDAAEYGYIGPLFFYTIMDTGTDTSDLDDNFGLVTDADVPKPAYCALQEFTTGSSACSASISA
ncbi:MAG: Ig-like domain-containing protein [Mycobacterium sp.]